jgi:aspartyl-tRNA(Asn)/glutamyl-tRNA(Gln) amidotransferase subunit A
LKKYYSLSEIRADIELGNTSVSTLTKQYISEIESQRELNAFLEVFEQSALEKASEVDQKIKSGKAGRLAGLVIGIKDNICYKNHKVSASSKILEGFVSVYNSTVVERLLAEDAVIIGRLNCDEFAMGSSNENSAYGPVLNPVDHERVPGGSSGGSAAAVAAGLCHAALGSDTGGSIRQPAAFCGLAGLKPTYGRVSRYGLIAYASSFDQIGPITHCSSDAAEILSVISGPDGHDATMAQRTPERFDDELGKPIKGLKIAYINSLVNNPSIHPLISELYSSSMKSLEKLGVEIGGVDFDYFDFLVPGYYVLTTAEASSNLARFDGVRYGYRNREAGDLDTLYKKSRSEGFGAEVKRRIMLGTFVLSSGYYDAYYAKAQKVRRIVRDATEAILKEYDAILLPTTPDMAFKFGENSDDPIKMYLQDIFTVQANFTGHPAITFNKKAEVSHLPVGMQLIGRNFEESKILNIASQLEDLRK